MTLPERVNFCVEDLNFYRNRFSRNFLLISVFLLFCEFLLFLALVFLNQEFFALSSRVLDLLRRVEQLSERLRVAAKALPFRGFDHLRFCAAEIALDAFFAKGLDAFVAAEQVAAFAAPATVLEISFCVF